MFCCVCQVASIYRDASIGNAINIVVVKIVVLEADQVDAFYSMVRHGVITFLPVCLYCWLPFICVCTLQGYFLSCNLFHMLYQLTHQFTHWLYSISAFAHPDGHYTV